ncbi:rod shape-determining protein RodA [Acidimicrobium ferrooxidans DSM 10331]|uniref:peptidoglycan glycosyltransferase n=1 Tax=Acidimicrobium ferrooxidans (strain DSM 10331 / JCM 15462 / NBRC 103882 / ICP) TaxID=525909 RepID=C7LYT7_ACIFD|nr:rod shape-determining protein RodA [Acidimicrobium ferrooxidans]ACU53895.1 rod shape-determining protein RodA [Acidimicrobium ferrooxidans DSM 10331]
MATSLAPRSRGTTWARLRSYDALLWLLAAAVGVFGVVMVYSATRNQLELAGLSPHYYLDRQAIFWVLGLIVMSVVAALDLEWLGRLGYWIYGAVLLGLVAVLSPVGSSALGSQRWFQLGPIQVQPSEFAPIGVMFGIAAYLSGRDGPRTWREVAVVLALGGVPALLVVKQPDLGTGIVVGIVTMVLLVMGGATGRQLLVILVAGVLGIIAVVHLGLLKHYQLERLLSFVNPQSATQTYGYNLVQSKIAIGSGHIFGTGLFKGSQTNLAYVPEQQTDFIFTAVGEQLGFIGAGSLVLVYGIMLARSYRVLRSAADRVSMLLVAGAIAWIGFSVFQNIGMTIGIMPITGIPLPFVSYGGSAMLGFSSAVGIVLSAGSRRLRRAS